MRKSFNKMLKPLIQGAAKKIVKSEWKNATHLYSRRPAVAKHNAETMSKLGKPIVNIRAEHCPDIPNVRNAKSSSARGLETAMNICKGARVMTTQNLLSGSSSSFLLMRDHCRSLTSHTRAPDTMFLSMGDWEEHL